jgi:DNA-binding response OmpR family regulator
VRLAQNRALEGARILVAEDSALQARDLKILLEEAGAKVVGPAKTVAEVFALSGSARITCAVLDVMLGQEPVFQAARIFAGRGVAIIFHTGNAGLQELGRDWPNARVVSKPAPFERLLEAVEAACSEKEAAIKRSN